VPSSDCCYDESHNAEWHIFFCDADSVIRLAAHSGVAHFSHYDAEQHILMDMLCVIILSDIISLTVMLIIGMLSVISLLC
jgi:hypothetical protein